MPAKHWTGVDKEALIPRFLLTMNNDLPEFWALSHADASDPQYVWGLCAEKGIKPYLASIDTKLFFTLASQCERPPWEPEFRIYRYTEGYTLGQLLQQAPQILERAPAWLVGEPEPLSDIVMVVSVSGPVSRPDCSMPLLTDEQRERLHANWEANQQTDGSIDHRPVVKLFIPDGRSVWLLSELSSDGELAFGLCDLGLGFPELGYVSMSELTELLSPLNFPVQCDSSFQPDKTLSVYADLARQAGGIVT